LNFDNLRRVYDGGHVAVDDVNLSACAVRFDGCDVCVHDVAGIKADADDRAYAVIHAISIVPSEKSYAARTPLKSMTFNDIQEHETGLASQAIAM
jgi:hypothetical protein